MFSLHRDEQHLRLGEPETGISINFLFVVVNNSFHRGEHYLHRGEPVNGLSISFLFAAASNSLRCGEPKTSLST